MLLKFVSLKIQRKSYSIFFLCGPKEEEGEEGEKGEEGETAEEVGSATFNGLIS